MLQSNPAQSDCCPSSHLKAYQPDAERLSPCSCSSGCGLPCFPTCCAAAAAVCWSRCPSRMLCRRWNAKLAPNGELPCGCSAEGRRAALIVASCCQSTSSGGMIALSRCRSSSTCAIQHGGGQERPDASVRYTGRRRAVGRCSGGDDGRPAAAHLLRRAVAEPRRRAGRPIFRGAEAAGHALRLSSRGCCTVSSPADRRCPASPGLYARTEHSCRSRRGEPYARLRRPRCRRAGCGPPSPSLPACLSSSQAPPSSLQAPSPPSAAVVTWVAYMRTQERQKTARRRGQQNSAGPASRGLGRSLDSNGSTQGGWGEIPRQRR